MAWGEIAQAAAGAIGAWYDNRMDTRNMHQAQDFNAAQAGINRDFQSAEAAKDRDMQMEFAKNGIRMRVADAVAAGLHPLVGAGVTPYQGSPIGVGGSQATSPGYSSSHMGQDISRAIGAVQTSEEREAERLKLDLLRSQINETDMRSWALANEIERKNELARHPPGANPELPPDARGVTKTVPVQIESRDNQDPSRVAGLHPAWQRTELWPGTFWDLPRSQGESPFESMEGLLPQALTAYKNIWVNDLQNRPFFRWLRDMGSWYRSKMRPFNRPVRSTEGGEE